jgi:flagellar basal body P-ring formation protein FlgA
MKTSIIFCACLLSLTAQTSQAFEQMRFKKEAIVSGDVVRMGDLIEGTAHMSTTPLFRAPDPGTTGSVKVEKIAEMARRHGIEGILMDESIREIAVSRTGRLVEQTDIEQAIAKAAAKIYSLGKIEDMQVRLDRDPEPFHLSDEAKAGALLLTFRMDRSTGRFEATVPSNRTGETTSIRGTVIPTAEVIVPTRTIQRGEIILPQDVRKARLDRREVGREYQPEMPRIIGQAARKVLAAGTPIADSDLTSPEVVERNSSVLIIYEGDGITLTARGKAMTSGASGDLVSVMNIQTKRVLQGNVTGPSQVTVALMPNRTSLSLARTTEAR